MVHRLAWLVLVCLSFGVATTSAQSPVSPPPAEIQVVVRSEAGAISRAQIIARGETVETDVDGKVTIRVPPGPVEIT
ncbi:MAG: hypothetical protein ABJC89_20760, partial [Acidobacteriota bacterium]